ncbi:MAG: sugar phosphate nucleotidyltransferase [Ilumatobacteraceae bacterium]
MNHPSKTPVEQYFTPNPELLATLERSGKDDLAAKLSAVDAYDVRFVHQPEALGLGHAVGMAAELVGDDAFAVLLPDEIMGSSAFLSAMIAAAERTAGSVVGLKQIPREEVSRYGVVAPAGELDADGVLPVADLVEKPKVDEAPSEFIIIGRYVCSASVMAEIGRLTPGAGGELQLTDALRAVCAYEPFHGLVGDLMPGGLDRYDTGNPLGWWEANLELGLGHPVHGAAVRELVAAVARREGLV